MTSIAVAVPLVVAACFGVLGPRLARRLPPRHATWLLSAGAVTAALSALAMLFSVGLVLVGQAPSVASEGHWSASILREHAPVEPGVTVAALSALIAAMAATIVVAGRRGLAMLAAYRDCRRLPGAAGDLVVVPNTSAGAVAIPGRPGRIVVSQALLIALSASERRALLAHERAHLGHGHHWHRTVVSLAAAANPLLRPLCSATLHATERWADEEAAAEVGDRATVAAAVARAARMSSRRGPVIGPHLAVAAGGVPERVAALLGRPARPRPDLIVLAAALLIAGLVGAVVMGKEIEHLFEFAGRAYAAPRAT